jgi:hypothetical protein
MIPKPEKIYQMNTNYTKRPYGHKLYQTAVKYTNIFPSKALQNVPKLGFFGLKMYHLAILLGRVRRKQFSRGRFTSEEFAKPCKKAAPFLGRTFLCCGETA